MIRYPAAPRHADEMLEAAIEAGAEDVESDAEGARGHLRAVEDFFAVRDALEAASARPESAKLEWRPRPRSTLDEDTARDAAEAARRARGQRRRAERLRQFRQSRMR